MEQTVKRGERRPDAEQVIQQGECRLDAEQVMVLGQWRDRTKQQGEKQTVRKKKNGNPGNAKHQV